MKVDTFGTPELCAWLVGGGEYRFQTTSPEVARKFAQRKGARLVAWSLNGDYLRIYQERMGAGKARKLLKKYLDGDFSLGKASFKSPLSRRKSPGVSGERESEVAQW
jgi:hypothetical protein